MDTALLSAEALLQGYARQSLSPVEALQAITERIARHNPAINAFAVLNPHALREAGESEQRWRAGRPRGLLDGVPCTVKDLIDVAGFPTRRGSRTTSPEPVAADAPSVLGLRAAGAIILGKTTTTEFGWKSPGDCPLHGITRNPWNLALTPGGSSSGAGAAGAAGFGPLHLGTDAGGSVRIPAAWCGLVGLKPSFGRVPQWPLGAFGPVAVAGPLTRTIRDSALMLSALARADVRDPFCLPDDPRDWRDGIEAGVAGLRVSVLRRPGFDAPVDADGVAAVEEAAQILADSGAEIHDEDPGLPDMGAAFRELWAASLAAIAAGLDSERQAWLDHGFMDAARMDAARVDAADLMRTEAVRVQAAHAMARFHQRFDLVLCPTVPGPPPPADQKLQDPAQRLLQDWAPWTFTFNLTRQPAIAVPLGLTSSGLPRSVQLSAALYRDDLILRGARVLEKAAPFHAPTLSFRGSLGT